MFLPGNILGKYLALRNPTSLSWVTALHLEATTGSSILSPRSEEGPICLFMHGLSQQPACLSHFFLEGCFQGEPRTAKV